MKIIEKYDNYKIFHSFTKDIKTGFNTYYCEKEKVEPIPFVSVIEQTINIELEKKSDYSWNENENLYTCNEYSNKVYNDISDLSILGYRAWINKNTKKINQITITSCISDDYKYIIDSKNAKVELIDNKAYITVDVRMTIAKLICTKCGEVVTFFRYSNHCTNVGDYLFNNDNNIKFTRMYKEYLMLRNKEIHTRYFKNSYVFNKETGRVYSIDNVHIGGSGIFASKKSIIKNVTYDRYIPRELLKEIQTYYMEQNKEEYQYTINDLIKLIGKAYDNTYYIIVTYIKKHLGIKNTSLALFIYKMINFDKSIMKELKNKTEKEILMYLKVSLKDIAKFFNEYKSIYDIYMYCLSFRYMNKNYVKQMLMYRNYQGCYASVIPKLKRENFIHQYAKHNGMKRLYNQLNKVSPTHLTDTMDMYKRVKKVNKNFELNLSNDIEAIHDILSKNFNIASTPNKKITENKELKAIFKNFVHNNISYRLAKNTHELIDVGNNMDICVGSYGERAVKKQCFIVVGYNTDNKPVTCIEINKRENKFYISQAKKKRNQTPDEKEKQALIDLCNTNNIEINSYDLQTNSLLAYHYENNMQNLRQAI